MAAYYNEINPEAAAWLRELIKADLIAPGGVDERSIENVFPDDLRNYTQCHFFAGIGVWSYALRRAGWPDDMPVWTGSCPCQPFSDTGIGSGFNDERHLWPALHYLIKQRRPGVFFGEQVASNDGLMWLDLVQSDMEGTGYAFGAVDLCSAGFGAPHIRQRLHIVGIYEGLGHAISERLQRYSRHDSIPTGRSKPDRSTSETGGDSLLACRSGQTNADRGWLNCERPNKTNGFWKDADWLLCRDGNFRPVEPGTSPMADGPAERVGRLRGYGNAINSEVATGFIKSSMHAIQTIYS